MDALFLPAIPTHINSIFNLSFSYVMKLAKINQALICLTLISITLLLIRVIYTGSLKYSFLVWNLILAAVPYIIAYWINNIKSGTHLEMSRYTKLVLLLSGACIWLLFLPNAFYIVTDFIHLRYGGGLQFLFDTLMLTSFSVAALALGSASVVLIYRSFFADRGSWNQLLFFLACSFLSAIGVYLGRVLRWNSWDIITDPLGLLSDLLKLMDYNYVNLRIWSAIMILSAIYLTALYLSQKLLHVRKIS